MYQFGNIILPERYERRERMDNKLKDIRIKRNLSQDQLAKIAGVTRASISRYENGKRNISIETAKKIATAINVDWTSIF